MNILKRIGTFGLGLLMIVALKANLPGQDASAPVTGSASLGAFNRYVFRGYRLGRDSLVLEPVLAVSVRGFSVTFWGNIDMMEKATPCFVPDRPGQKSFNETDLTVSYARDVGRLGLTAGFIYYGTKYTAETQELYVGASLDVPGSPALTIPGHRRVSGDIRPPDPGPCRGLEKGDQPRSGRLGRLFFGIGRILEDLPAERRKLCR